MFLAVQPFKLYVIAYLYMSDKPNTGEHYFKSVIIFVPIDSADRML